MAWVAGLIVLLGVSAMAIVDAFRLPVLTRHANERLAAVAGAVPARREGPETEPDEGVE